MIIEISCQITKNIIPFSSAIQNLCKHKYAKHPRGCPNYGHKRNLNGIRNDLKSKVIRECPPTCPLINHIFDFSKPISIIYNKFKIGKDAEQRRLDHPKLTHGGWYNFRYWQNRARKELYAEVAKFLDANPNSIVDLCPEAHGVNFTKLMKKLDINLKWGKWPPKHSLNNVVYQISLGGFTITKP